MVLENKIVNIFKDFNEGLMIILKRLFQGIPDLCVMEGVALLAMTCSPIPTLASFHSK
jgi:hypothetical protein